MANANTTTTSQSFLNRLSAINIRSADAIRIDKGFSSDPSFDEDLFMYGFELIAEWLATEKQPTRARPKEKHWQHFFDNLGNEIYSGASFQDAFNSTMKKIFGSYPGDVEQSVFMALLERSRFYKALHASNNRKGSHKTIDYLTQLQALNYKFELNTVTNTIECNGEKYSEGLAAKIRSEMRDAGFYKMNELEDAIIANAFENSYHAIKRYLENLTWDGKDYFSLLVSCFQTNTPNFEIYLRKFLLGSIRKAYEPYQNYVLCLVGFQKIGKSKFVKWLCPLTQYRSDSPINPDEKDSILRLATKWICEIPELGAITRRADRESLKAYLSREEITVRRPYGKFDETKPVLASFIGTFNDEGGILNDSTGSRRFVIAEIEKIEWNDYLKIPLDQLWAQMMVAYQSGESTELTLAEFEASETNNREKFDVPNRLEDLLLDKYMIDPAQPNLFETASNIYDHVVSKDYKYLSPTSLSMEIARTLLKLGAKKATKRIAGNITRIYYGITRIY